MSSRTPDPGPRTPVLLAVALLAALPALAGDPAPVSPTATLSRATVPAVGRQEAIVTVSAFGRYAITASSAQGTAVQLVDRMAGPGEVRGVAGEANGRLDAFLDRGEYQLVALSHDKGKGEAKLAVTPFAELSGARPPLLVELKLVEASLDDVQQRSYWVHVEERRTLAVEAGGRNLADLRVWQDGTWLVDAEPQREVVQPRVGKPLAVCRLVVDLNPGLYLLTAYGGAGQPWADDDGSHPFVLRAGIPADGIALRRRRVVGPFGVDRVLVPAAASYVRLELPEARPATLAAGDYDESAPYAPGSETAEVAKESVPPVAELELARGGDDDWRVVTVTAEAGQPYVLQHFEKRWVYPFHHSGETWVSSVHSGHPADSVDATGLVVRTDQDWLHLTPLATDVIDLGAAGWARRCNLLDTLTVHFRLPATGKVEVTTAGVEARVRFEPFMMSPPKNYRAPDTRPSPSTWDLDAGFWVLTVEPVKKGIVDVVVKPTGLVDAALGLVGLGSEVAARPVKASVRFPSVRLDILHSYAAYLNRQPGVEAGFVVRPLPVDLDEPLPLTQRPGEELRVPFETAGGLLRAEAEDGSLLDVRVDGGDWQQGLAVTAGSHTAEVRVTGTATVVYSLGVTPHALLPTTPLPPVPDALLAGLPDYPVLADGEPQFLDLERDETRTFLLRAAEPALYRLESTGLLETSGTVRTRVVPALNTQSANGVGRNFFVEQYLREGDYQLSVSAQGRSRGHLSVVVEKAPLADGGVLAEGVPARVSLPAGTGVVYRFRVDEPGELRLRAIGADRVFSCRLEDGDGWPLLRPGTPADVRVSAAGDYRVVVLPEPVAARCLTLLERVPPPLRVSGHGPHPLPLGRAVASTWMEPEGNEPRVPDRFELELTAPADVTIALTGEMEADIVRLGADGSVTNAGRVPITGPFGGRLEAGRYRLEAVCGRVNNRVAYTVTASAAQLVPGERLEVSAPAEVPLSVGREGLVELWSFGSSDVRARLLDAAGRELAAGDDRPDDWNFHLAAPLAPGSYRLRVEPVGSSAATTTIVMEQPEQVEETTLPLPATTRIEASAATRVYPLGLPAGADVVVVGAAAEESVAIAVEAAAGASWRTLAAATGRAPRLELPLPGNERLRLRVWSVDRRGGAIRLQAAALAAPRASEADLARGVTVRPAAGTAPAVGVVAVDLERPGVFRLDGPGEVRASARPGVAATSSPGATVVSAPVLFVFAEPSSGKPAVVRGTRLTVAAGGEGLALTVPGGTAAACDLEPGAGGPVLVRAFGVGAQPGLRVLERAGIAAARPAGAGMAVGELSATAVALAARQPAALLWRADGVAAPFDARLEAVAFPALASEKVGWGSWSGTLQQNVAVAADLPPGAKQVRLALDAGTVAVFADGDAVESVHAAGGPFAETVVTRAGRLVLLHARAADDSFAVEVLPVGGAAAEIVASRPFESLETAAGTRRLAVPPPAGTGSAATLHVRGAVDEATFLGADGTVARGADLPIGAGGGTLLVRHRPGRLLAWFDRPETLGESLWGLATALVSSPVDVPTVAALSGRATQFKVSLGGPAMLHLRAAAPMATRLVRPDGPPAVEVHADGTSLDAYLPTGVAELGLRAMGGGELSGTATLTSSPVVATGEGLGPELLLAPGETRTYSFVVTTPGPVGLGVHASADVVDCELLDGRGLRLGRGVVQMPTLAAGTYLLALHAPADGAPVRVRPALAGLVRPDTGPPAEVIRCYLDLAKGKAVECGTEGPGSGVRGPGSETERQGAGVRGPGSGQEETEEEQETGPDEEGGDEGGDS